MCQSAFAVLGVNAEETQPSIAAALTFGILWMDRQREQLAGRAHVEGLKRFVPAGRAEMVRQRMAHLNREAAKWQLDQFDERAETYEPLDCRDSGNIETRLTRAVDATASRARYAKSIARTQALVPDCEAYVESPTEIAFRLHGLEFARARLTPVADSFRDDEVIHFGLWTAEYTLDGTNESTFRDLVSRLARRRQARGERSDPLFGLCPERWLESLTIGDVRTIDERLDQGFVYSRVPAFASTDRAMIDVLTCSLGGRLAVLELKADDDIHLPSRDSTTRPACAGISKTEASSATPTSPEANSPASRHCSISSPLLSARIHRQMPCCATSHPISSWTVVQVDERWRYGVRVVNRKHPQNHSATDFHG